MHKGRNHRMGSKKRGRSMKMRGGSVHGSTIIPSADINEMGAGNFAASQTAPGTTAFGAAPNVALAQSGGKTRKGKRKEKMYGGNMLNPAGESDSYMLSPSVDAKAVQTGGAKKGGYMANFLQSALVPMGLLGLNQYAHEYAGKRSRGHSRVSRRLFSRRR